MILSRPKFGKYNILASKGIVQMQSRVTDQHVLLGINLDISISL